MKSNLSIHLKLAYFNGKKNEIQKKTVIFSIHFFKNHLKNYAYKRIHFIFIKKLINI